LRNECLKVSNVLNKSYYINEGSGFRRKTGDYNVDAKSITEGNNAATSFQDNIIMCDGKPGKIKSYNDEYY